MSLLQEALKRKELDENQRKAEAEAKAAASVLGLTAERPAPEEKEPAGKTAPAEPLRIHLAKRPASNQQAAAPEQPPAVPQAAAAEPVDKAVPEQSMPVAAMPEAGFSYPYRRTASRLWFVIGAVGIMVFIVVGVAGSIMIYRLAARSKDSLAKQIEHNIKTAAVATGDVAATAAEPGPDATPPAPGATPPAPPEATQGIAAAAGEAQVAPPQPPPADIERKPPKPAPVKPKKAPAKWPALKLTGILRGSGSGESSALINGKMVGVGQSVNGVTVVAIKPDEVLLKCENETKTLRVGAILY